MSQAQKKNKFTVTSDHINAVWGNADFGSVKSDEEKRKYILEALMKCAVGYYNGHTITQIMLELKLISTKHLPTKKGRNMLRELVKKETK